VNLIAPETSPNTDGIDISSSTKVFIEHSTISTGSILDYSLSFYIYVNVFFPLYRYIFASYYFSYLLFIIGDDCVAMNSGSKFINITNVKCGPGHGIRSVVQFKYCYVFNFCILLLL
jgi:polygalacturonase